MTRRPLVLAHATLVIGVVAVVVAALVGIRRQSETVIDAESEELVKLAARMVVDDVYRLDVRSLRVRLRALREDPDVREAYVTDPEGIVLADGTAENERRDQALDDSFGTALVLSRAWLSSREDEVFRLGGPITAADGSLLGYIQVNLDRSAGVGAGEVTTRLLGIALLCVLLGGAFLWRSLRAGVPSAGGEGAEGEPRGVQEALDTATRDLEGARVRLRALQEEATARDAEAEGLRQAVQARGGLEATIERLSKEQGGLKDELARAKGDVVRLERALKQIQDDHVREQEVLDQLQAATTLPEAPLSGAAATSPPGESQGASPDSLPGDSAPVLDLEQALGAVDADGSLLMSLVAIFLDGGPRRLLEMRSALERGDAAALERGARSLKGALGTLGAIRAMEAARRLEILARQGDRETATAYGVLESELERLRPQLLELQKDAARRA